MWEKIRDHNVILLLLLTGAVTFFLKYISPLLGPVLVAMVFVTICGPMLQKIQKRFGINRQVSAVLVLLFVCVVLAALVWVLFSWIVGSLPEWVGHLQSFGDDLARTVHGLCDGIGDFVGVDGAYLEEFLLRRFTDDGLISGTVSMPGMLTHSLEYVKVMGGFWGFLAIFFIASVLLAKDYDGVMNRLLDREECHVLLEVICSVIRYIATYVKAQLIIMTVIGSVAAGTLLAAGVEHGVLWGILAGILDALPFIGTGIVLMPLAFLQLLKGCCGRAAVCVLLYGVCVFLRQLLEPKLIGRQAGIPPIAVLTSLYAGIKLFGVMGIVKGPLGFVLIYQTWMSLRKREERKNLY